MKALGTAVAAAFVLLGAACANPAGSNGPSAGGGDACVDLPQAERDFCMRQRGFRGGQAPRPLDPKPSPSGY